MVRNGTKNGNVVRDTISGYEGVVICRSEYLNGCVRLQVQAQRCTEDGKPVESIHVDEEQVIVLQDSVEADVFAGREQKTATGGPREATRRAAPTLAR
jgi:hypothetical protein